MSIEQIMAQINGGQAVNDHIADANKMVSDTPRTDEAYFKNSATMYDLAGEMKQIERELNVANEKIEILLIADCERLRIEEELNAANQRIKRLEEAGDAMDKTAEPFVLDTIDEDIPMSDVGEQYEITYDSPPTAGDHVAMDRARKQWRKAKEAKP